MTKEIIKLIDSRIAKHERREENLLKRMNDKNNGNEQESIEQLDRWYTRHANQRFELERLRDQIIEMLTNEIKELNAE